MKAVKSGALVALVLAVVLAVAVGPAHATVIFTESQTNASPWWDPIGNTTNSSVTGKTASISFVVPTAGAVTCASTLSAYVPATHTQMTVTAIDFKTCVSDQGTVSSVSTTVNSPTPWKLHLTDFTFPPSSSGTLNIAPNSPISIVRTEKTVDCDITIPGQSVRFTFTNNNTSLVINDPTVMFTGSGANLCPANGNLQITATYTLKPDTATDDLKVTLMSPSKWAPNTTAVSGSAANPTLKYGAATITCNTGTFSGTTGVDSPILDVATTFSGNCKLGGIAATVTCSATIRLTATSTGPLTSATIDLNTGFTCTIAVAGICNVDIEGPQTTGNSGTLDEAATTFTATVTVNATRTGSSLCGPASGPAALSASYNVTPTTLEIV